jgi:hypothetical protein
MLDPEDFKCKYLTRAVIRQKAEEFRERCWPKKTVPVDMEEIIEKCLGLSIIPESSIGELTHINAYLRSDLKGIVVDLKKYMDERHYGNTLRFTFAHEIGHLVLHNYMYNKFSFSEPEEYYEFITGFPEDQYSYFELQANEFAGRLLVPREKLVEEIRNFYKVIVSDVRLNRIMRSDPDMVLERIATPLCKPFGVSEYVIKIRVQIENLWPPID